MFRIACPHGTVEYALVPASAAAEVEALLHSSVSLPVRARLLAQPSESATATVCGDDGR